MKTTATNRRVRELLSNLRDGKLEPRPDFQRRLVWSNKDKCNFIETVLLGYPFPEIYVAAGDVDVETGEAKEMLVDGQQRVTTLYQYFSGSTELKLPKQIRPYSELSKDEKENFLQYDVVVRDLGKVDLLSIREVFRRINATKYALNAMEIHNARYEGEYKDFAEQVAQKPFFDNHKIFSSAEIRRMQDTRYALTIVTTILSTYFNREDEIEKYLNQYNDEFHQRGDIDKEIELVLSFIEKMNFQPTSRVWQKTDLFTLIIEVHKALVKQHSHLDANKLARVLTEFYDSVTNYDSGTMDNKPDIAKYHKAALQATNDRSSRIARGEIINNVIRSSLIS